MIMLSKSPKLFHQNYFRTKQHKKSRTFIEVTCSPFTEELPFKAHIHYKWMKKTFF